MIAITSDAKSATLLNEVTKDKLWVTVMCDGQICIEASGDPLLISPQMAKAFAVTIQCLAEQSDRWPRASASDEDG